MRDVELMYIEAVQGEALRAATLAQRLFLTKLLITTITFALAVGLVRTEKQAEVLGLKFTLDFRLLLVAGSIFALLVLVLDFAQYERAHRLAWRAGELYEQLGYVVPKRDLLTPLSPFGMPYVAAFPHEAVWGRRINYPWVSAALWAAAWLFLVGTQIYVAVRLIDDWFSLATVFVLVPLLTFAIGGSRLYFTRKEMSAGSRPWHIMPGKSQPKSP